MTERRARYSVARARSESLTRSLLWQIQAAELPEPAQEVRFHPVRRWRFDLAWKALKIAVEIEGGTYTNGRHTRGAGYEGDCEKYSEAAILGWRVIRVTPQMVEDGRAINLVARMFETQED